MFKYMLNQSLCLEWFEWVFTVETGGPSRVSTFPFREQLCFKKQCKFFLKNLHFSADVEDWNECFPQFDSGSSFPSTVMSPLYVTVCIFLCPCKHPLCLSQALVCSESFINCKFQRWNLSYIPRFALGKKSSTLGFFGNKSWVSWGDIAERYQRISFFTYYCQWIPLKI